jgi:hypothetical protein
MMMMMMMMTEKGTVWKDLELLHVHVNVPVWKKKMNCGATNESKVPKKMPQLL